jgi:hypothetical protein
LCVPFQTSKGTQYSYVYIHVVYPALHLSAPLELRSKKSLNYYLKGRDPAFPPTNPITFFHQQVSSTQRR